MRKFSIISVVFIGFVMQSCSYSSPKEALESNIIGKNSSQKTNAKTSRRPPEGNNSADNLSSNASTENNYNAKRSSSNYDAYQHYQTANPPKKAKRRPLLNLKELNDLMDREATITLTERTTIPAPQIDANSDLQEVIKHNKHKNKHKAKTKKRVKVLVVKKEEAAAQPINATKAKKNKTKVANKKTEQTAVKTLPEEQNKNTITPPEVKKDSTAAAAPIANSKPAPVAAQPIPETIAMPAPVISIPTPAQAIPAAVTAPVAPQPAVSSPAATTEVDTSKMTPQELEKHLKDKFNNKNLIGSEDLNKSYTPEPKDSGEPALPTVPLPAIPNATESNMDTGLSRLNSLFVDCYYSIKHAIMSLISSGLGLEW